MTSIPSTPREISSISNSFQKIPLIGKLSSSDEVDPVGPVVLAVLLVVLLWALAIVTFGVVGLYLPMVILSPICLVALVIISRG